MHDVRFYVGLVTWIHQKVKTIDVRRVSAICANPSHIGLSRGRSSTFPINGRPLGPGGYGNFDWLEEPRDLKYLVNATTATATPAGTTQGENIVELSNMKGKIGWRRIARVVHVAFVSIGGARRECCGP